MERGAQLAVANLVRTVGLFAPAGYDPDPERLARASRYFEAQGQRVVDTVDPGARTGRFAATDDARVAALMRVVHDPEVDIALALRGGYGSSRLLPHLDFDAIAAAIGRGLRLVAHSDFTAIHLALLAKTGATCFAGPMASYDFGGESVDAFTEEHFWRAMREQRVDATFETGHAALAVRGPLWGGNLTMLTSLVGTTWMPDVNGGVLFIEDVNERPYRIERMLLQLHHAGILDRQKAVLCGAFSDYRPLAYENGYDLDAALDHVRGLTRTPLVTGLPFGHVPRKLTLAVGAPVDVTIADGRCRIEQTVDLAARYRGTGGT